MDITKNASYTFNMVVHSFLLNTGEMGQKLINLQIFNNKK